MSRQTRGASFACRVTVTVAADSIGAYPSQALGIHRAINSTLLQTTSFSIAERSRRAREGSIGAVFGGHAIAIEVVLIDKEARGAVTAIAG